MFKNYLRSSIRFLRNNGVFAGINLFGLSIALAVSFIILLYVVNEFSYDNCHKNRKNVYRVINYYREFKQIMAGTPYVLASTLKSEYPQVIKAANTRSVNLQINIRDDVIMPRPAYASGSDIFDIFTLPLIYGTGTEDILDDKNSIVLSREMAERIFPGEDPVGKKLESVINGTDTLLIVKGVFEDVPVNSVFRPQCLVSGEWTLAPINQTFGVTNANVNWTFDFWNTWIKLANGIEPREFEKQFEALGIKYISENPEKEYSLQNLGDVYLKSENIANTGLQGNIKNVRMFSLIALLVVIVAAINYIILSTAVSVTRGKEIGIRKTFGGNNINIRVQLLAESIVHVLLVLPFALILSRLSLPVAGRLFQAQLEIIPANIPFYILIYLSVTILIGVFSGLYTSSYLSRLKVMEIIRNTFRTGHKKQLVRSVLIVIQLVIFCTFVASNLIIRSQYLYAVSKDLGYYNKDILIVSLGRDFKGYSAFINNLKSNPNIIMAAGVMDIIPMRGWMSSMYPHFQEPERKVKVEGLAVDYNFISTMGIQIIEGREFSEEFGSDLKQSVMLNEEAVKELGIEEPVAGKQFYSQNIIGVVKDFNLHSIHTEIPPLLITMTDRYILQVVVHYKSGTMGSILPFIETEWKKAAPDRSFIYFPIEMVIENLYSSEKNLNKIITISAVFSMLIAALGLFGLVLFVSRSRTKEIGIRKVFGSSGEAIIFSFLRSNFILVLIASIASVPVTVYFLEKWLNNFAFRTTISWWIFLLSFLTATFVVLVTVFIHSFRASRTNPVKALRYE